MKYKIGDKVRVRKDLVVNNEYGGILYILDMDEFKDREGVITNMGDASYQIGDFWWTDEMLEPNNDEMLEPNNDEMLEYALEKLGMTKEELEDEMNRDKEDVEKAKEIVRLTYDIDTYCDSFKYVCQGCKVKEFKDKYSRFGRMICSDVYKYLKEKGEI